MISDPESSQIKGIASHMHLLKSTQKDQKDILIHPVRDLHEVIRTISEAHHVYSGYSDEVIDLLNRKPIDQKFKHECEV